jgi:hypothetical protein
MRRSRKPLWAVWSIEGSNPSPSVSQAPVARTRSDAGTYHVAVRPAASSDVVDAWRTRSLRALHGHYNSARRFETWARVLNVGALTVSVAAAVLTAFVLTIHAPSTGFRVVTATLVAVASLLALLDNQLDLRVRAAEHRRTGAGYSKVRRALEIFAENGAHDLDSVEFRHIEQMWLEVSQTAPIVPGKPWREAEKRTAELGGGEYPRS